MVSSKDVARLAGVSQPTVSRALRDDPRLTDATKQKVRQAADQLGYSPNSFGRALATGRSTRIGLLVTDLDNQFYIHVIAPMHEEIVDAGYELILITETSGPEAIAARATALGLGGVILATTTTTSLLPLRLADRGIPFVYFNRISELVPADATVVDPTRGMQELVEAMVELGHQRVGAILGPRETSTGATREAALRSALADHGLELADADTRRGPFTVELGQSAARELLDSTDRPTVLVCANDLVALGALNAAAECGLAVPEDVSVVGFDALPITGWQFVHLATIHYDLEGMARTAARAMVQRMDAGCAPTADADQPQRTVFPTSLVLRRSLGAAPL
ncbi:MAG: LacI family DNA-binding transcriptional regulator [Brachybacterium sp.]|nr:LacI family DNA-binding transcriptional regulator [Brachybacterium sp.]